MFPRDPEAGTGWDHLHMPLKTLQARQQGGRPAFLPSTSPRGHICDREAGHSALCPLNTSRFRVAGGEETWSSSHTSHHCLEGRCAGFRSGPNVTFLKNDYPSL